MTTSSSTTSNQSAAFKTTDNMTTTTAATSMDDKVDNDAEQELSQYLTALNAKFCDSLSQELQQAFATAPAEFPHLQEDPTKAQALLQRLHKSYMRHVDVVEVYAARNIFTLQNLPPNRRARIAEIFQSRTTHSKNGDSTSDILLELKEPVHNDDEMSSNDEAQAALLQKMQNEPPPTAPQVQEKRHAIGLLQRDIAQARQKVAILQRYAQEMALAQRMSSWPDEATADQVLPQATALAMGADSLQECRENGHALRQQAQKRRLENAENEASSDGLAWQQHVSSSPKDVEEYYHKERVKASAQDLKRVHQMLVGNNRNTNGSNKSSKNN